MLIGEEPLSIRVENNPYAVVMRTPGDERFLAAGFCLAEGLVDRIEDFATLGYCEQMDPNVISVTLTPQRREKVSAILERRRIYQPDELRYMREGDGQGSHPEYDPPAPTTPGLTWQSFWIASTTTV